ncbi:MAG: AAA family ATPase [Oscillospiraceae bacterium]|nr:AAA family ATPase [Oscillospiraceae bacterium]
MNGQHGHNANSTIAVNKNNKIIAFAGKGGTGKTSLCGMLIQYLCDNGRKPILAVDADANTNLNEVLGINTESTMGGLQEELRTAGIYSPVKGISKDRYAELKLNLALTETPGYDLLVIGRPEGRGCYCNVSGILERQLTKIQNYYPYIVVDNEAGMEHISRGILPKIDVLILVSDCSRRGIQAAARIVELVNEMEINPKSMGLIVNRAPDGILNDGTMEEIERYKLNLFGVIGKDNSVYEYDCAGKPLVQIPETSPVKQAIKKIAEELNL